MIEQSSVLISTEVIKQKLVANMIKYLGATKQQSKAIVDGCFDGESNINLSDLISNCSDINERKYNDK